MAYVEPQIRLTIDEIRMHAFDSGGRLGLGRRPLPAERRCEPMRPHFHVVNLMAVRCGQIDSGDGSLACIGRFLELTP